MKKIQVEVAGIFADQTAHSLQDTRFTLLMTEIEGERKLPIVIGLVEAQAIALALDGTTLERPLMHDLFKETIIKLGYMVKETVITSLKDDIYFANLYLATDGQTYVIDSRPSDAIAISLRAGAPIFINDELLKQASKTLIKKFEPNLTTDDLDIIHDPSFVDDTADFQDYTTDALEELLAWVVSQEEYEKAAIIRDELKKRT